MSELFLTHAWLGAAVWVVLYVSDYAFTLKCARLYQKGVREKLVFGGSYELNPIFQRDIDSMRLVSPRFVVILALSSGLLLLMPYLVVEVAPESYLIVLGAWIIVQFTIHIRHFRNLVLFRAALGDAVHGRIAYSRRLVLRQSSVELFGFFLLYVVLWALTLDWFIFGGAVACLALALQHWLLSRRAVETATTS